MCSTAYPRRTRERLRPLVEGVVKLGEEMETISKPEAAHNGNESAFGVAKTHPLSPAVQFKDAFVSRKAEGLGREIGL